MAQVARRPIACLLQRPLNNGGAAVFVHFLTRSVGVDVSQLQERRSESVSEGDLVERVDDLAAILTVMSQRA